MTADEQLARLPFHKRMQAAHRLVQATPNQDERKVLLATMLWPSWSTAADAGAAGHEQE